MLLDLPGVYHMATISEDLFFLQLETQIFFSHLYWAPSQSPAPSPLPSLVNSLSTLLHPLLTVYTLLKLIWPHLISVTSLDPSHETHTYPLTH